MDGSTLHMYLELACSYTCNQRNIDKHTRAHALMAIITVYSNVINYFEFKRKCTEIIFLIYDTFHTRVYVYRIYVLLRMHVFV